MVTCGCGNDCGSKGERMLRGLLASLSAWQLLVALAHCETEKVLTLQAKKDMHGHEPACLCTAYKCRIIQKSHNNNNNRRNSYKYK